MPTSPKTQDPDPLKSTKPSSTERAAPMTPSPKTPGTITAPADITNEPAAQSISHESTPQGASNELTTQGISSDPTPNDTSQVTPQDTSDQATPTATPIPPRPKSKPGPKPKYKARDYTSPWRKQFERRCPTTLPDGSLMLRPYVPATHYYQSPAQLAAMRTRKKNMQDPDATQDHDNQDHETTHRSPDANQDQERGTTISAPDAGVSRAEEASTESSQKRNDKGKWKRVQPGKSTQHPYFRRDINVPEQVSGDERVFLVDLPTMEDAYLQEAFPYRYPFNDNDGPTQYMPIEWYIPQGPFAAEDFFSMQKLQYSSSIMKTMKFWNEGLPLEQYYAHGFEMASRVVLDRERSRIIKEHKAARPDIPLLQPMEKLLASIAAAEETSTSTTQTTPGPTPVSASTSGGVSASASTSASTPVMASSVASTTPPGANMDTHGITPEQSSAITPQPRDTSQQPSTYAEQASMATQKGNEINLLDYYQVNKFIAAVFETDADVRSTPPVPLSNGACRILQTLLGDIETKIVAMGCHRQRQELTRLLAEKDAFNVQIAERAVKVAKDAAEADKAAQAEKDAAAIAAAIAAKNVPSGPVASRRRRKRRRKKPVDETLPVPKVEQTIKTGYQYERLHVDDMDEYMEKWIQTQYNRVRESSVDPPSTTTTPFTTTRKRKYGQPGNDQDMTENGPNARPSAIVTPRERTPSISGDDGDESQSGLGFRRGSRPYVDDPMRIGTSMDPFLKARDFLANRFFQEQARNAASEPSVEGSQSAGPSSAP
ncbi:hypothetical protein BGZ74_010846 [Mortierella antarctica]|nr:hypothetical protein BGZ74_010846 [Mortierella antarctica]